MKNNTILLTGGLGYIGSHIYVALKKSGYEPIIFDNLSNSYKITTENIEKITGQKPVFFDSDIRDERKLSYVLDKFDITNIIHLAAKKSVFESINNPLIYISNNIEGLTCLIKQLEKRRKEINFIFSSSATVYSSKNIVPFREEGLIAAISPYGRSKILGEALLTQTNKDLFKIGILRYFNPAGAHISGYIGQNEKNLHKNLFSVINETITKRRSYVPIYGNDYNTEDGTCVRDYFHVMDLANGHVNALSKLMDCRNNFIFNLGSGKGYTVKQIIQTFSKQIKVQIPYMVHARRKGDIPKMISCTELARKEISWEPKYSLEEICETSYKWYKKLNNE